MSDYITTQFVSHDPSWFTAMAAQQASEEAFSRSSITFGLQVEVNDLATLINSPPKIVLFAINLHKDFIDIEGVTVASVLSL